MAIEPSLVFVCQCERYSDIIPEDHRLANIEVSIFDEPLVATSVTTSKCHHMYSNIYSSLHGKVRSNTNERDSHAFAQPGDVYDTETYLELGLCSKY